MKPNQQCRNHADEMNEREGQRYKSGTQNPCSDKPMIEISWDDKEDVGRGGAPQLGECPGPSHIEFKTKIINK